LLDEEQKYMQELYNFMKDSYKPTMEKLETRICSENKKESLEKWFKIAMKVTIKCVTKELSALTDKLANNENVESSVALDFLYKTNHLLMLARSLPSTEDTKRLVNSFEKYVRKYASLLRKFGRGSSTSRFSSGGIDTVSSGTTENSSIDCLSDEDEYSMIEDFEDDENHSINELKYSPSLERPLSTSSNISNSHNSKKHVWSPPVHIPDTELALNKAISKFEKGCLSHLQEKLGQTAHLFSEQLLLRFLSKFILYFFIFLYI
jgi:hypothetical protein